MSKRAVDRMKLTEIGAERWENVLPGRFVRQLAKSGRGRLRPGPDIGKDVVKGQQATITGVAIELATAVMWGGLRGDAELRNTGLELWNPPFGETIQRLVRRELEGCEEPSDGLLRSLVALAYGQAGLLARPDAPQPGWFDRIDDPSIADDVAAALESHIDDKWLQMLRTAVECSVKLLSNTPRARLRYQPDFSLYRGTKSVIATPDFIADSTLVEIKVAKNALTPAYVRQVVGYVALNRIHGGPAIRQILLVNPRLDCAWQRSAKGVVQFCGLKDIDELAIRFEREFLD